MKEPKQPKESSGHSNLAHRDHLEALEDHAQWQKDLERWRGEYQQAIHRFAHRHLPELELVNFEESMDRHEAAMAAHDELMRRHEQRLRVEKSGLQEPAEEAEALHQQMHDRHELSRRQHEHLHRAQQAILQALAMFESEP